MATSTGHLAISDRDSRFLLGLTALLILTTWSFFGRFSLTAVAAGLAVSVALRLWHDRHPTLVWRRVAGDRTPEINMSAIHVGGDPGGLLFAGGCVAVLVFSMPVLRWFAAVSALLALVLAGAIVGWRRTHSIWSPQRRSVT